MPDARKPLTDRRLHFIGIGGCGMSGLALVARELGARVTGSDARKTIYTESLDRNGVTGVTIGHDTANVPNAPPRWCSPARSGPRTSSGPRLAARVWASCTAPGC